jgi:hypothetical protein
MFERLIHRVASKPSITKKVRVLLLEREYTTRTVMGTEENADWYAQLTDSSTHPSAVTIGKYAYATPLLIPSLEDKAMHEVALDAWKIEDPSQQALPDDFREQLRRIDKNERTLFAIMLALYRAKHPDAQGLTTDALLEYILKLEWRKRLEPAGYCSDNLHFLMLATIMRTYILSPKENEDAQSKLNEEKLYNFGLGQYVHQGEGDIELKGLEPDILGEYLILRGFIKRNVVPRVKLENLVVQAWELNPSETASFFVRCMQNFHNELTLSAYLLNPPETVGAKTAWARAVLYSILYYTSSENFAIAEKFFDVLCSVDSHNDLKQEKLGAATLFVVGYAKANSLIEAKKWYGFLSNSGVSDDLNQQKAIAVSALVVGYALAGSFTEARKWSETLSNLGGPNDFKQEKATAEAALVTGYALAGNCAEAEEWYGILTNLGNRDDFQKEKARAASVLILAYTVTRQLTAAQKIYDSILLLGDSPEVAEWREASLAMLQNAMNPA